MSFYKVLFVCAFIAIVDLASCNRENKIKDILETVKRIEEHIAKEDRIREITDIIRIEQNVDRMNDKLDRVLNLLDNTVPPAIGRSDSTAVLSRDLGSSMETIENGLRNLELSVKGVEETMKKLDFDPVKVNEIERRTTQIKDDMNVKLRKTMNILSELYEMNKEMRSRALGLDENGEALMTPKSDSSSTNSEFFVENLEEMERKIKEQFSILSSEIRSEVSSLKLVASSASSNCQTSPSPPEDDAEDEDDWQTPRIGRIPPAQAGRSSSSVTRKDRTLDNLVESLGRSTREIRQEIQQGIQGLDTKLQNLTAMAQSQPRCSSEPGLEASESVASPRRAVMPPEQSVRALERRAKMDSCTKSVQNVPNPKSCADLRKGGATCDGIYVIFPKGRRAVRVLCDMTTDGGGWTVLMRRGDYGDKMTSFNRNWLSYKNGFGDTEGEFWLGNDVMHHMTHEEPNALRIHMSAFDGDQVNLDYSTFSVGNDTSSYRLHLGVPSTANSAANSLSYHNNHPFSTFDRKNDHFDQNCAATYKGGWWFNGCYFGFLTGEYFRLEEKRENWQGILWYDWKGNAALKGAEMMIRPKSFVPA